MLDLNIIRNNLELVCRKTTAKGVDFSIEKFIGTDKKRRKLITEIEGLKGEKKKLAKETGYLRNKNQDTSELESQSREISHRLDKLENQFKETEQNFKELMLNTPNLFHDSVPIGQDSSANRVVREGGKKPVFSFKPKPHWELGEVNSLLDFPRAAKISAARFSLYFGTLAKLERVLINMMLNIHTIDNGYTEVFPPFLVNDQSLIGTGNLPKFKEDLFKIEGHNLYLIPTAEVPLTNIHRDEIFDYNDLPRKYVAYTPCFRSEAGSYGKDIRGLIRQHQFNKVELLKFSAPESSYQELESLTRNAENILQKLGLHYRVVLLCSGDMSFSAAKTYDLEVWMPNRNDYLEISSCSNFEDFQARRARIKYKSDNGKKEFLHTLNGSGLAVGRTVAAILENYQQEDGKVKVPDILKPEFSGNEFL